MLPAANRHPKATHPWLLMGVQACRLPALKPSKRSKPSKPSKPLKSLKPLKRCWLGNPSPMLWEIPMASSRRPSLLFASPKNFQTLQTLTLKLACFILQPTGTPRPHIGMKPFKTLLTWQPSPNALGNPSNADSACFILLLQPTGTPRPHIHGFLWASKPAVCQPLNPPKRSKPLNWHASSSSQQPPRGHTSMASSGSLKPSLGMLHPAANRHPKATHPWLLMGVQACRLPALKPSKQTLQTLQLQTLQTPKKLKTLKTLLTWQPFPNPSLPFASL